MLYMLSLGIVVYLPKAGGRAEVTLPHIFTDDELQGFFYEADHYEPANRCQADVRLAKEYPVLFRMLYCCGLRNSEGGSLAADQADLENGVLTILDSKGGKDRRVYMAEDLTELCSEYYSYLCQELRSHSYWFFPGANPEKPLRNSSVDRAFNRFWNRTRFSAGCSNKPTVHDLRFTFVTDRINQWVLQGIDVEVMMPYLQKYLGHKSLQDSCYYYHHSGQLYESIRHMDKTSSLVIPEVPDYE
ncbi:MAG: tyrosine-type recombinase/integrase [Clostridiales bacterium]|nr:tyrosine-type recombinase/integrase [Clostridiales bacterium]